MALVAQGTKEEEEFFDCLVQNLSFRQAFLLLIWSFFAYCRKGCDFFQTLIGGWLKESLKQTYFEPPRLKTKYLVLSPKTENLLSSPQILEIMPCTKTLKMAP
jgi:hypothetical protein